LGFGGIVRAVSGGGRMRGVGGGEGGIGDEGKGEWKALWFFLAGGVCMEFWGVSFLNWQRIWCRFGGNGVWMTRMNTYMHGSWYT
jgi:hypothetical protein